MVEQAEHPYKTYIVIPDYESTFKEVTKEELKASTERILKRISERNKAMIPPDIRKKMKEAVQKARAARMSRISPETPLESVKQ